MTDHAVPVGGPLLTRPVKVLLWIAFIALAVTAWRFTVGLGPSTGLSDGYPWGLWIAFDVVTGTALACGGYAVALLVYILNRGKYHPLVRPALLTSALGYSVAAVAIVVDVGRPWFVYRIPLSPGKWNLDSALLEVALCVMAYVVVLWIELSPAFLERWRKGSGGWLVGFAKRVSPVVDKSLLWFIALGLLLPTMHQSSLGTVILLAGPRLHPLWHTAWIPMLFLLSCIAMGYAVVVMESTVSSHFFGRKRETRMLASLSKAMIVVIGLFILLRFVDIVVAGKSGLLFSSGVYSLMFWLEMGLAILALLMLFQVRNRSSIAQLWRIAMFIVLAGTLYRFNAYLVAFDPGPGWSYFPSIPEMMITIGFVAVEILLYIVLVKRFPILSGTTPAATPS